MGASPPISTPFTITLVASGWNSLLASLYGLVMRDHLDYPGQDLHLVFQVRGNGTQYSHHYPFHPVEHLGLESGMGLDPPLHLLQLFR